MVLVTEHVIALADAEPESGRTSPLIRKNAPERLASVV